MKTIVAAIDFSDVTEQVLAQTSRLAKATGSKVILTHWVEQLASFYNIYGYSVPDANDYERVAHERAEAALQRKMELLNLPDEQVDCELLTGVLVDSILDCATKHQADLIVLGSYGHGVISRVLLGSTAQKIINKAALPTLIIPAQH